MNGRKRHIAVDTEGSPIVVEVHPADVQDRDGVPPVLAEMLLAATTVEKVFADGGCSDPKLARRLRNLGIPELLAIVRKALNSSDFSVLRRKRVVARTFAWMRCRRRLAKEFERTVASSVAWAKLAACRFLMRRLGRLQPVETK